MHVDQIDGAYVVRTPFTYYDRDNVVVIARERSDGTVRVSDDGDATERLMFDGIDPGADRIQRLLDDLSKIYGVAWDKDTLELSITVSASNAAEAVFQLAEVASQLQAFASGRTSRSESDFKERVVSIVEEAATSAGVDVRRDAHVLPGNHFTADVLVLTPKPLAIIVAGSTEKLLEAELLWSTVQRLGDPTNVIAVIESMKAVGIKQAERAAHFTDKTVTFATYEAQFAETIRAQIQRAQ